MTKNVRANLFAFAVVRGAKHEKGMGTPFPCVPAPLHPCTVADSDQAFGGSQIGGRQEGLHLLKYQSLSATIVGCNTEVATFCRPKSGYFCWSNYGIFQGKTTVWKRFISLIQKRFEMCPKQWASFFTCYTDLVCLQNVFERYKSMLRASVCHCFGYP